MKLTQCDKGHFYDAEKFAACPHCQGSSAQYNDAGDDQKTDCFMAPNYGGAGYSQTGYSTGYDEVSDMNATNAFQNREPSNYQRGMNSYSANASAPNPAPAPADGSDEGRTMAYFQYNGVNAGQQPRPEVRVNGRPVVGWLVCIDGNNYGVSYNLYAGKNFIGRSAEMDVCLRGDESVSRSRHAIITYEPKERRFFAQPGESHELFYVNDSVVLTSASLEDRDVISIGKSVLVFVPFCDERYGWDR